MSWSVRCFVPVALLAAGCGDSSNVAAPPRAATVPVSGKVTFRGKPLANADVSFHSADGLTSARGRTDASGLYFLTTYQEKDGASVGLHKVTISHDPSGGASAEEPGGDGMVLAPKPLEGESFEGKRPAPKSPVPVKYSDPAKTDLSAEVKAGSSAPINFDLN